MANPGTELQFGSDIIVQGGDDLAGEGIGEIRIDGGAGVATLEPLIIATGAVSIDWRHRGRLIQLGAGVTGIEFPDIATEWVGGYWFELRNASGADLSITSPTAGDEAPATIGDGYHYRYTAVDGKWQSAMFADAVDAALLAVDAALLAVDSRLATAEGEIDALQAVANYDPNLVIIVDGNGGGQFDKLQDAFDWINANDSANAANYLIMVYGATLDTVRISPNLARVKFKTGGSISVGVDFTVAGTYRWSGSGAPHSAISVASGAAVTFSGASPSFDNMLLSTTDAASAVISGAGAGAFSLYNCVISGTSALAAIVLIGVTSSIRVQGCSIRGVMTLTGCTSSGNGIVGCEFTSGVGVSCVEIDNSSVALAGCRLLVSGGGAAVCSVIKVNAPTSASGFVMIAGNTLRIGTTTGAAIAKSVEISGSGAGAIRIAANAIYAEPTNGIGVHLVGTFPADLIFSNNQIQGGAHAVLSTSDSAGASAQAQSNVPFYVNTLKGSVTNVTFASGTVLAGGNVQA